MRKLQQNRFRDKTALDYRWRSLAIDDWRSPTLSWSGPPCTWCRRVFWTSMSLRKAFLPQSGTSWSGKAHGEDGLQKLPLLCMYSPLLVTGYSSADNINGTLRSFFQLFFELSMLNFKGTTGYDPIFCHVHWTLFRFALNSGSTTLISYWNCPHSWTFPTRFPFPPFQLTHSVLFKPGALYIPLSPT